MRILQVNRNYYGTTENLLIQIVRRGNIAILEKIKEESKRISISDPASGDFSIEVNEINLVQRDIRNLVESNRMLSRRINTTRNEDTPVRDLSKLTFLELKVQLEIQFGETFSVQSNYTEFSHRKQRAGEDLAALVADLANFHNLRIRNVQQRNRQHLNGNDKKRQLRNIGKCWTYRQKGMEYRVECKTSTSLSGNQSSLQEENSFVSFYGWANGKQNLLVQIKKIEIGEFHYVCWPINPQNTRRLDCLQREYSWRRSKGTRRKEKAEKLENNLQGSYKILKQINDIIFCMGKFSKEKNKIAYLGRLAPFIERSNSKRLGFVPRGITREKTRLCPKLGKSTHPKLVSLYDKRSTCRVRTCPWNFRAGSANNEKAPRNTSSEGKQNPKGFAFVYRGLAVKTKNFEA
ncbi:hypothetical protein HZH68_000984 [Vespula germanica]|uniref:Uncharacterized protein n=1 Tax=Vespula germanica TaxID=30212 RepID=A0A834NUP4_VESGE|nr:hypothetical protein HZH68_000984 [Vespula germanica]